MTQMHYDSQPRWLLGIWWMIAMSAYYLLKGTALFSDIEAKAALAWIDIVGNVLLGIITAYPFWWIIESQMDSEKKARTLRLMKDFIYGNQFRITELASQIRNAKGQKRRTAHTMEDSLSDLNGFEAGEQTDEQRAALLHLIGRHYSYDREDMKRQFEAIHHYRNQFSLEFNQLMNRMLAEFNSDDATQEGEEGLHQHSIIAYQRLGMYCERLFDQLEEDYPSRRRKGEGASSGDSA